MTAYPKAVKRPAPDNVRALEDYLKAFHGTYGLSGLVLAASGEDVILQDCWGFADAARRLPNAPSTRFLIGSMTKQFTAYCVLSLKARKKLDLAHVLERYIPGMPNGDRITIHDLLAHTAGIFDFTHFPRFERTRMRERSISEAIRRLRRTSSTGEPGTEFRYSSSGYLLLGRIIEIVADEAYDRYLARTVFRELGMMDTGVLSDDRKIPNMATGYEVLNGKMRPSPPENPVWLYASGGIYSTIGDLCTWNRFLMRGRAPIGARVLALMFKPYHGDFGYGMGTYRLHGRTVFGHGGATDGFSSDQRVSRRDGLIVLSLHNKNKKYMHIRPRCFTLMSILLGKAARPVVKPRQLPLTDAIKRFMPGKYLARNGLPVTFRIGVEDELLTLRFRHPGFGEVVVEKYYLTPANTFQDCTEYEEVSFTVNAKTGEATFGGLVKTRGTGDGKGRG